MTKRFKIASLLCICILCLSVFTVTAFAADSNSGIAGDDYQTSDGNGNQDGQSSDITPPTEAPPVPTEAPDYNDGNDGQSSDNNDYNNNSGYDDGGSGDNNNDDYNYNDYGQSSDNGYSYEQNNNYDFSSNNSVYNYGNEETVAPEPTKAAQTTDYYKSNKKVDENELSKQDWDQIALSLQNADSGSGDDFNFIKKNDSTSDNGIWMLITGVLLILLSLSGIGYVIYSSVHRKKAAAGVRNGNARPRTEQYKPAQRSRSDYGDNYAPGRPERRRRLQDTADIQLPKEMKKHNDGDHYK